MDRKNDNVVQDRKQNKGRLVAKKGKEMGERKRDKYFEEREEHKLKKGCLEPQEKWKRKRKAEEKVS